VRRSTLEDAEDVVRVHESASSELFQELPGSRSAGSSVRSSRGGFRTSVANVSEDAQILVPRATDTLSGRPTVASDGLEFEAGPALRVAVWRTLRGLSRPGWLAASELRVGLGCMRLSTDESRDEELALATIAAAAEAGITVFDTAHAYGRGAAELGHNERLLARALRRSGADESARIVTKGGMTRTGGAWIPDGRAKAIRSDCEASLAALDGLAIDLYLIHAPDPKTPWGTSLRALARLVDDGVVRRVGIANVNRPQLDEALELAPVTAVQVALSPYDDRALRGGVVERCAEKGVAVIAHSPLGGPRRAGGLARRPALADVAEPRGATAAEVALAWLLELSPAVIAIPGARRPETARSAANAARFHLGDADRGLLDRAFGGPRPARLEQPRPPDDAEVILVMGIPGAGKSRIAEECATRGYLRLNRDERGGSLRELADQLDEELASGARRVVLDNTYLTRAARSYVIETASRHRIPTRCIWLDTPLAQAQVNLVERLLERFGSLPTPEELREVARREPGVHAPTSQMRTQRELEPPSADEGFAEVEHVPFARRPPAEAGRVGVFVAAAALSRPGCEQALDQGDRGAPHLVFDWSPDGNVDALADVAARLAAAVSGPVESALCPHGAGPPSCWCRPPLPGLPLAFARTHGVDPSRSILVGTGPAHRTLATTLGARYVAV
jgi:aryl-alcohol dehydrogenase-like predicted oxidoreductase/predicted kinase